MTPEDIERLRLRHINRNGSVEVLCSKAWAEITAQAEDITRLRTEVERLREALNADPQTLRLHLGEMTAQEMRTLKAGFQWVSNRAALTQGGEK
jgi:GTPase involved in cell partitioning and DNA repair